MFINIIIIKYYIIIIYNIIIYYKYIIFIKPWMILQKEIKKWRSVSNFSSFSMLQRIDSGRCHTGVRSGVHSSSWSTISSAEPKWSCESVPQWTDRERALGAASTVASVIEESDSPWSFPVVLVREKDELWRFCVDYRHLNDVTRKDSYLLLSYRQGAGLYGRLVLVQFTWPEERILAGGAGNRSSR